MTFGQGKQKNGCLKSIMFRHRDPEKFGRSDLNIDLN
jgi:hypothetical protein